MIKIDKIASKCLHTVYKGVRVELPSYCDIVFKKQLRNNQSLIFDQYIKPSCIKQNSVSLYNSIDEIVNKHIKTIDDVLTNYKTNKRELKKELLTNTYLIEKEMTSTRYFHWNITKLMQIYNVTSYEIFYELVKNSDLYTKILTQYKSENDKIVKRNIFGELIVYHTGNYEKMRPIFYKNIDCGLVFHGLYKYCVNEIGISQAFPYDINKYEMVVDILKYNNINETTVQKIIIDIIVNSKIYQNYF